MNALLCTLFVLSATAVNAQPTQAFLAQRLTSSNAPLKERIALVAAIRRIPANEREPVILNALLQEGQRLAQEIEIARAEARAGKTSVGDDSDYGEYRHEIVRLLTESHDRVVVPQLLALIDGINTINALADFGEDAFRSVLAEAKTGEDQSAAMIVLARMLNRKSVRKPLSASSRQQIVAFTNDLLTKGPREAYIVIEAIRLARTSGDPVLLGHVQRLATNSRAVQELGVFDPEAVKRIQAVARGVTK